MGVADSLSDEGWDLFLASRLLDSSAERLSALETGGSCLDILHLLSLVFLHRCLKPKAHSAHIYDIPRLFGSKVYLSLKKRGGGKSRDELFCAFRP